MLKPDYVTGFIDGEGYFGIGFTKYHSQGTGKRRRSRCTLGIHAYPRFAITQTSKEILEELKNFFGLGNIIKHSQTKRSRSPTWYYSVNSLKGALALAVFFMKHPLHVKKDDFKLWKLFIGLSLSLRGSSPKHPKWPRDALLLVAKIRDRMNNNLNYGHQNRWTYEKIESHLNSMEKA